MSTTTTQTVKSFPLAFAGLVLTVLGLVACEVLVACEANHPKDRGQIPCQEINMHTSRGGTPQVCRLVRCVDNSRVISGVLWCEPETDGGRP